MNFIEVSQGTLTAEQLAKLHFALGNTTQQTIKPIVVLSQEQLAQLKANSESD
ncbi:MAG: hypothetical protein WCX74_02080 [Candidatus Paceibacterota bacterium]